jgi:hypothetical protein
MSKNTFDVPIDDIESRLPDWRKRGGLMDLITNPRIQ